jgi:hypothetical protein
VRVPLRLSAPATAIVPKPVPEVRPPIPNLRCDEPFVVTVAFKARMPDATSIVPPLVFIGTLKVEVPVVTDLVSRPVLVNAPPLVFNQDASLWRANAPLLVNVPK